MRSRVAGVLVILAGCFGSPPGVSEVETGGSGEVSGSSTSASNASSPTGSEATSSGGEMTTTTSDPPGDTTAGICADGAVFVPPFEDPWRGPVALVGGDMPCGGPWGAQTGVWLDAPPVCACDCGFDVPTACGPSYSFGSGTCPSITGLVTDCVTLPNITADPRLQVSMNPGVCDGPTATILPSPGSRQACQAAAAPGDCVPQPDGHAGPCVFSESSSECPADYPVSHAAALQQCDCSSGCDLAPFCADVAVIVHGTSDCSGGGIAVGQKCTGFAKSPQSFRLEAPAPPGCMGTAATAPAALCCVAGV